VLPSNRGPAEFRVQFLEYVVHSFLPIPPKRKATTCELPAQRTVQKKQFVAQRKAQYKTRRNDAVEAKDKAVATTNPYKNRISHHPLKRSGALLSARSSAFCNFLHVFPAHLDFLVHNGMRRITDPRGRCKKAKSPLHKSCGAVSACRLISAASS
jgi:hypothetical protein